MRPLSLLTIGASFVLAITPVAAAQFTFNFAGNAIFGTPAVLSGSGVFTTSDVAQTVGGETAFAITGITGTFDGSAINGLQPGFLGSDDLYFTTGPSFLDGSGVGFTNTAGTSASFYYQSTGSYRVSTTNPFATAFVTAATSSISAVPEPATWAMMIGGFGMIGYAMRRRRPIMGFSFS